jgi:8-amino-7-oxononanoate synthase
MIKIDKRNQTVIMKLLDGLIGKQSLVKDFYNRRSAFDPHEHPLLDIRSAHRWFQLLKYGADEDVYNFQEVVQGKSGAEVMIRDAPFFMMSSYDYLGLIGHPHIEKAAIEAIQEYGTGTGGVRLLTGTNEVHYQLEKTISRFKGTEAAMALSSGYMANLAVIAGLFGKNDLVITDENIHRSITDAIKVAGVPHINFKHNDTASLKAALEKNRSIKRKLVIVEGVYSMDGDICPLPEIVSLKEEYGAFLMVDEAHSLGVLGATGRGVDEHFNIDTDRVDIYTCSLSKAIPANGGFVAAKEEVIVYLKHGGAPYMFSAALSPANTAAAAHSFTIIDKERWRLKLLWKNTTQLTSGLRKKHIDIGFTQSPVIPLICGLNEKAFCLSKQLFNKGFLANAIVYPAVPLNKSRLRLCCTASQAPAVIEQFIATVGKLYPQL